VVSITQSTEMGAVYTVDELGALCDYAHAHDLRVHLDGARLANALVATGSDVPTMVRDTGVDVLTFGLTKDGAMYGETVVFVDPTLAERAAFVRKQAGQLSSKTRFVSAQIVALLRDDLWLRNARRANEMAASLASCTAIPRRSSSTFARSRSGGPRRMPVSAGRRRSTRWATSICPRQNRCTCPRTGCTRAGPTCCCCIATSSR